MQYELLSMRPRAARTRDAPHDPAPSGKPRAAPCFLGHVGSGGQQARLKALEGFAAHMRRLGHVRAALSVVCQHGLRL